MKNLFLCLTFVSLAGCASLNRTVVSSGKAPTLSAAEKPVLEKMTPDELTAYNALPQALKDKLESNNKKLMSYSEQNAAVISEYNSFAKIRNSMSDDFSGVKK